MSDHKKIKSGVRSIMACPSADGKKIIVVMEEGGEYSSIWLTPEQSDDLLRQVASARVEISKAKPI